MLAAVADSFIIGILAIMIFMTLERLAFVTGKKMLTDKLLNYLAGVHSKTAPDAKGQVKCYTFVRQSHRNNEVYFQQVKEEA